MVRLEQRLKEDITVELAYNREKAGQLVYAPQATAVLFGGDPNTLIPNPNGSANPIANPNVGDMYVESRWVGDRGKTENEVLRGTVGWQLDLGRFGKHTLAGMGEHGILRAFRYPQIEILVDRAGIPIGNAALPENAANFLFRRQYITPGNYDTYYGGSPTESFTFTRNGKTYHSTFIDGSVAGGEIERTMDTLLAATQSSFFDSRFIFAGGVRWDNIRFDQYGSSRVSPTHPDVLAGRRVANTLVFTDKVDSSTSFKPVTSTLGGVYPVAKTFSVFYNHGTNNSQPPLNARVLPDETLPPPFDGKSDDYGFMVNLLDGKFFVRGTAFEASQEKNG